MSRKPSFVNYSDPANNPKLPYTQNQSSSNNNNNNNIPSSRNTNQLPSFPLRLDHHPHPHPHSSLTYSPNRIPSPFRNVSGSGNPINIPPPPPGFQNNIATHHEDDYHHHHHQFQHQHHSLIGEGPGTGTGTGSFAASPEEWDENDDIQIRGSPMPSTTGTGKVKEKERKPVATRRRVVQSCSECRRRKIKCDKKFPCGPCILRQDESRCHEVGMAEKHIVASTAHHATTAELANVAHRLDALEAALIKNKTITPADLDHFLRSVGSITGMNIATAPGPSSSSSSDPPMKMERKSSIQEVKSGKEFNPSDNNNNNMNTTEANHNQRGFGADLPDKQHDETEDAALTLEQIAFGRQRAIGGHNLPHFGTQHSIGIGRPVANNDYHLASATGRAGSISLSSPGNSPNVSHIQHSIHNHNHNHNQPARKSSLNIDTRNSISHQITSGSAPSSRPTSRGNEMVSGLATSGTDNELSSNTGANIGGEQISTTTSHGAFGPGSRFVDTLSHEEKMARMDALLDLMEPTDLIDMFWRKTDVGWRFMIKVMPSMERAKFCVNAFVEKVDWLHRCLHIPSFLRQCNDLWTLPPERIVEEISMPFVSLYMTVCTVGLHFSDAEDVAKHFTPEEASLCAEQWYGAVRASMWGGDMMGEPTLEHVQAYILLSVLMNNRDRASAAWAMLGLCVKIAQNIGLSRLGAEQQVPHGELLPTWTGRWESLIQREVGRRTWWNLVFMDWSLAPSYNFSVGITPDQIKTALPANIEDEDIIDGQPLQPKPANVRTKMSYQLARVKFAEFSYRQIWQANNGPNTPYSFVVNMDAELRKTMLDLPPFFQPDSSDRVPPASDKQAMVEYYEKTTLNLGIHARMLRLHRPWLSRGYEDERFAYSKEQCIRAARAALRLMNGDDGVALFLEKWWIPLFYVSVSGMVLIIDLLRTKRADMYSSDTEKKISEIKGCLDQMRKIVDVSPSAKATVRVMDFMMIEVEDRRRPHTLGKRKAESSPDGEDDGLQRAVKKLVQQARLEADSPTNSHPSINPTTPQEIPSRSSSRAGSKEKERPVFDAYPMPSNGGQPGTATKDQQNTTGQPNAVPPQVNVVPTIDLTEDSNTAGRRQQSQVQNQQQLHQYSHAASQNPLPQNNLLGPVGGHPQSQIQTSGSNLGPPNGNGYESLSFLPSPFNFPIDPTYGGASSNAIGMSGHSPQPFPFNYQPTPSLDPAVEQLLNSYFPSSGTNNPNTNTNATANSTDNNNNLTGNGNGTGNVNGMGYDGNYNPNGGVVPDDFLNRVFSFSWDNLGPAAVVGGVGGNGEVSDGVVGGFGSIPNQGQGQVQGQGQIQGQGQPGQPGQGQGQAPSQGQGHINQMGIGYQDGMMWGVPDGWGGGVQGWMA